MSEILTANLTALARRLGRAPALLPVTPVRPVDGPPPMDLAQASAWLGGVLPSPPPPVLCCIGIGDGIWIDAIAMRAPAARLLIIEPDPAHAAAALMRRHWAPAIASGQITLLVGPDFHGATAVARELRGLAQAFTVTMPDATATRPADVARAQALLTRLTFEHGANDAARRALSSRYVMHTVANLPRLAREGDAARLTGALTGTPAIIAAAGPSLDRNIHDLAPVLDRAVLIACDTAAWPLVAAGAPPDLVVAVDASEANARHLSSLPAGRAHLVSEGSVHPSGVAAFEGRTFFFNVSTHEPWPWLTSIGLERGRLDAWGSVATTAFALALNMGCNPIIFAGADFAFTDGRPYCRGTSFEPIWATWVAGGKTYPEVWEYLIGRWPAVMQPDLHGRETRTAGHLVAFRDWVVERAASHPDRTVVNATNAGLLHGASILQASATSTLAERPLIDRDALHRHLRTLHRASRGDLQLALASATSLLSPAGDATLDRWRAFTDGAVSREALRASLASREQQAWALGAQLSSSLTAAS